MTSCISHGRFSETAHFLNLQFYVTSFYFKIVVKTSHLIFNYFANEKHNQDANERELQNCRYFRPPFWNCDKKNVVSCNDLGLLWQIFQHELLLQNICPLEPPKLEGKKSLHLVVMHYIKFLAQTFSAKGWLEKKRKPTKIILLYEIKFAIENSKKLRYWKSIKSFRSP